MKFAIGSLMPLLFATVLFSSCTKEMQDDDKNSMTDVTVEFDNIIGGQNLFLNTGSYTNAAGENFSVSMLQYFVSNFELEKEDGSRFVVNQDSCYFLVQEDQPATRFARLRIPSGNYTKLRFILGVDSLRSTMDISKRTGVLDPASGDDHGMYWGWNSGYIFFRMEGLSDAAPADPSGLHKFRYHIGGFGGYSTPTINNIKTMEIDLRSSGILLARPGRTANVHLMADIMQVFNGHNTISIASNPTVMFSDFSRQVAHNYAHLFHHHHTEN